jgi:putative acetyltransferase
MIEIRTEESGDAEAVRRVHERAFGQTAEARLVEMLCENNKALISLVAVIDGQIVGHILFSAVSVSGAPEEFQAVGLAPVAVLPEHQKKGIGSKLIREGLEQCRKAAYHAAVVLGDPLYYSRFGFTCASDYGLENEYGVHAEFMALELKANALTAVTGMVKYQPEFGNVG